MICKTTSLYRVRHDGNTKPEYCNLPTIEMEILICVNFNDSIANIVACLA